MRRKRSSRKGIAAVEFAVIAPIMVMLTFGLIELGRISMVKQTAIHASREGARVAAHPNATSASVLERVDTELLPHSLDNAVVEFDPVSPEATEPGSLITVRVKIDLSSISWVPNVFNFGVSDIVAESTMRRESTF